LRRTTSPDAAGAKTAGGLLAGSERPQGRQLFGRLLHVLKVGKKAVEHVAPLRRDEKDVRVRDPPAARHQPDKLGLEAPGELSRDAVREGEDIPGLLSGQVVPERHVPLREHESVPASVGIDVQNRQGPLILGDPVRRRAPANDLAKHAVPFRHRNSSSEL
jgi:hypothetical protein